MRGIADRNVQFVSGNHSQCGVSKFPPELMADSSDLDGALGHAGILYGMDDPSRGHKEHQHNENRDHGPGKFDLITAINLRRLRTIVGTSAELCNSVGDQTENNYKNEPRDGQHHERQTINLVSRRRLRFENARYSRTGRSRAKARGKKDLSQQYQDSCDGP